MADTTLKVVIQMVDKISGNLKSIEGRMAGFSQKTRSIGTGMTALGGAAAVGLGAMVAGAADAEKAQAQLSHATLNIAHASEQELGSLEATSAALEAKGVLDGDNIKMGQAQLMTFGLSANLANDLSGSMADLAVNQFGVNATGEDMTASANMVAKALNGQFGILEKSGIRFTDAQKKMIEFGTESEKAAALQEGFAQNLKYTNEVAAGTTEGKLAKLKVTFENITETIGAALIPVLTQLVANVQPILNKIIEWMANNEGLVTKIAMVAAGAAALMLVLGPILIALSFLPAVIGGVGVALAILTSPITLVIAAIAALVVAGILLYKNWDKVKAFAKAIWGGIANFFKAWGQSIVNTFKNSWDRLKSVTSAVWNGIKALASAVWNGIKSFFVNWFNSIKSTFTNSWNNLKNIVSNVLTGIRTVFQTVWNIITRFLDTKITGMITTITGAKDQIVGAFSGIWETVKSTAQSALDGLVGIVKGIINTVIGAINTFVGKVNGVISKASEVPGVPDIGSIPSVPYLAKGTRNFAGGMAVVGEKGPELVTLPRGSNVYPNGQTEKMMKSRNITFNITQKEGESARELAEHILLKMKTA